MSGSNGDNHKPKRSVECLGLRYVIPYLQHSCTYLKDKFIGDTLASTLGEMFCLHRQTHEASTRFWADEIRSGRVEYRPRKRSREDPWLWQRVEPERLVEKGASVRIQQHVHERVVPSFQYDILFENSRYLAIHKPAGIASVDETGGKGLNSLSMMMREERPSEKTFLPTPAHRLDKPVSGVLLMGRNPRQAGRLTKAIARKDDITKMYIARCQRLQDTKRADTFRRLFPSEESTVTVEIDGTKVLLSKNSIPTSKFPESVVVHGEVKWNSRGKHSVAMSSEDAQTKINARHKSCCSSLATRTIFRRLGPPLADGTVLIQCQPKGGQRHQIRAHLSLLGWPIANDVIYGGEEHCVDNEYPYAYTDDAAGTLMKALVLEDTLKPWCNKCMWTARTLLEQKWQRSNTTNRVPPSGLEWVIDGSDNRVCPEGSVDSKEPRIKVGGFVWLHSVRYVIPAESLDVKAPLPCWASAAKEYLI